MNRADKRPVWLSTQQVMGSLHLRPEDRRSYEAYMEGRVLAKSAPEKMLLAWWLRQRTTVPLRWVSQHLAMGSSRA